MGQGEKRFFSLVSQSPDRETRLNEKKVSVWPNSCGLQFIRDGGPHLELAAALTGLGFVYQGMIFNFPGSDSKKIEERAGGAMLCIATRPELEPPTIKPIKTSGTGLEQHVFGRLGDVFLECTRGAVHFTPTWARQLPPDWAAMEFTTGSYAHLKHGSKERPQTAGYLVFLPNSVPQDQSILASFSLGATETLIFNYLIRTRYASVLKDLLSSKTNRLLVGRFSIPSNNQDGNGHGVPADLEFSSECEIEFKP